MPNSYILEITVEMIDAALAAQRGGAHRIELCSDLAQGGLTPGAGLMRAAHERVRLPIFAMIRPRAGDFVYSDAEFTAMRRDIKTAREMGMDGVVLGILKADGHVDVQRTRQLVEFARPLPVTFHRAFDVSTDLQQSIEDVIRAGATRILTSGGAATAPEGLDLLAEFVDAACGRIIIVPGSGIHALNISHIARRTCAREFHSGLSSVVPGSNKDMNRFETEIRGMTNRLDNLSSGADVLRT